MNFKSRFRTYYLDDIEHEFRVDADPNNGFTGDRALSEIFVAIEKNNEIGLKLLEELQLLKQITVGTNKLLKKTN